MASHYLTLAGCGHRRQPHEASGAGQHLLGLGHAALLPGGGGHGLNSGCIRWELSGMDVQACSGQTAPCDFGRQYIFAQDVPCSDAAEPQLERFKSQELGMLCWSFAKLAYMPAAALVRATLPHITAWRAPIAQVRWGRRVYGVLGVGAGCGKCQYCSPERQ